MRDTSIFQGIIKLGEYRIEGSKGGPGKVYQLNEGAYIFIGAIDMPRAITNQGLYDLIDE